MSPEKDSTSPRFKAKLDYFRAVLDRCIPYIVFFLIFFSLVEIIKFFVDLSRSDPHIYVQDLYVPALDKTTAFNTSNNSVYIDFLFARKATATSPSYADFQMTLSYGTNSSRVSPVGVNMIHGFSMRGKKRIDVKVETGILGLPLEEAVRMVSNKNVVFMAVNLVVHRKSDDLEEVVANVVVDDSGHMFSNDRIKFEHVRHLY